MRPGLNRWQHMLSTKLKLFPRLWLWWCVFREFRVQCELLEFNSHNNITLTKIFSVYSIVITKIIKPARSTLLCPAALSMLTNPYSHTSLQQHSLFLEINWTHLQLSEVLLPVCAALSWHQLACSEPAHTQTGWWTESDSDLESVTQVLITYHKTSR